MCFSQIFKIKKLCIIFIVAVFQISFHVKADNLSEINLQGQIPRVEFDSTRFDFGNIYRGQVVVHTYKFQNKGNGTLVFSSNIHAACGCLNTKIFASDGKNLKNIFKPDETGIVEVIFNTQDFSGHTIRTITLETNMGSSSPTVSLILTAKVLEEISSNPPLLYIGKVQSETKKTFTITMNLNSRSKLNNQDNSESIISEITKSKVANQFKDSILSNTDPLKVIAVESNVPYLKVKLLPIVSGQSPQILVQFNDKTLPIGSINAKIIVWNNSTYYKNFEIPVVGESIGHVQISAKYVEFGVVNMGKVSERVINFKSMEKGFEVTNVKVKMSEINNIKDSDLFIVKKDKMIYPQATSDTSVTSYILTFKLLYPSKLNRISSNSQSSLGINVSGFFVVKTNDPDYKEITVPFFGVLRKEP